MRKKISFLIKIVAISVIFIIAIFLLYRPNFFDAAKSGNTETVLKFINKGQNINAFDKKRWTALDYAARNGHVDMIKTLIVHQAVINSSSHPFAWTPLHHASKEGHVDSVKLLLENGADVHSATKQGYKPITFALKNSDYKTIKLLHQYGQSLDDISLFRTIMAFTRDIDWEQGSSPIIYQSLSKTALDMGVSERQVQRLEQSLFEAGALTWHDSGNHRRYGKRCEKTGRINSQFMGIQNAIAKYCIARKRT